MSEVLATVQRERREEREPFLGPHSLSVVSLLVQSYAPEGMEILAIGSSLPYKIDERGMVHFPEPVGALVYQKGDRARKHVVRIAVPVNGINGDSFTPFVTEKDSDLHARFKRYMRELVQDPGWRERPLPGRGFSSSLTPSEENIWGKWIRIEMGRERTSDAQWREQAE